MRAQEEDKWPRIDQLWRDCLFWEAFEENERNKYLSTLGPGLEGIVRMCTLRDRYTPDASPRACGSQLRREGSLLVGAMG